MTDRQIREYNIRVMKSIGLMSKYIDGEEDSTRVITDDMMEKIPFSSQYREYKDYVSDLNKAIQMIDKNIPVPENLSAKLSQVLSKLGIAE